MRRTLTSALPESTTGEPVRLQGWVHRRRELAKVTFLVVRDRTGLAQVVLPAGTELPPEETPVEVVGTLTANTRAPQGVEVTAATVTALSEPADTPAVELWRPTLDTGLPTLLDHAATTWRHPLQPTVQLNNFNSTSCDNMAVARCTCARCSGRNPGPGGVPGLFS